MKTLYDDDPGLLGQILDDQLLHAALNLPHSPVDPGVDVAASLTAFKKWLIDVAHASLGPEVAWQHLGPGLLAWHNMSEEQAHSIIIKWSHVHWQIGMTDQMHPKFAVFHS
jgi:hypothetical protein